MVIVLFSPLQIFHVTLINIFKIYDKNKYIGKWFGMYKDFVYF